MSSGKKRESLSFYSLICLISSFFGLIGAGLVYHTLKQVLTLGYAETQGTITDRQIEETRREKAGANESNPEGVSSSYEFRFRYTYEVGGREYAGAKVFYGVKSEDVDMARALTLRFPLHARVPVYYSTDNPSQSVLMRAPEGIDLSRLAAAFALLTGMGWSWYAVVWEVRRRSRGVHTVVIGGRTHARWSLGLAGWLVLMGLSVLASILLPSELILSLTWGRLALFFAILLAASAFVEWRRRSRLRAGSLDLVLDGPRGVLSLPPMRVVGRWRRFELPLSRIRRLHVEERFSGGGRSSMHRSGWALVLTTDEVPASLQVPAVVWLFEDKPEALWSWLKQRPELKHVLFSRAA